MMTQAQFTILDNLICSQIGKSDFQELKIWAALAYDLATRNSLTMSQTLINLALEVWG